MQTITVKMVRECKPRYNPTTVQGITDHTSMTLLEALNLPIEDEDKVGLFSQFGTDLQRRKFAIWCARRCKTQNKEIKKYLDAIEGYYMKGTHTKAQMEQADNLAYCSDDWVADWSAYAPVYWSAYRSAHWAAYWSSDYSADCSADSCKERKAQVQKIKRLLKEEK